MRPDMLDEAAEHTQHMIDLALANRNKPQMEFKGACYNCEESVDKGSSAARSAVRITSALSALSSIARWHDAGS